MQVSRRYWAVLGAVGLLAVWAVALQERLLLVGGAILGAWLLTLQYRFVQSVQTTVAGLSVTQHLDRDRVVAGETVLGTLSVQANQPVTVNIQVHSTPLQLSSSTTVSCELTPSDIESETPHIESQVVYEVSWPTAGNFSLATPTVTMSDRFELFSQSFSVGTPPSVTVGPRTAGTLHVGKGGSQIAVGTGEYESGQVSINLTPSEVRKYVPGDDTRYIDWKTTARFNETYVREFESEMDITTAIFFDHRTKMRAGQEQKKKVDFAREIALALVNNAEEHGESLGLYGIGDTGLTTSHSPSTDVEHYRLIEQSLRTVSPTDGTAKSANGESVTRNDTTAKHQAFTGESEFDRALRPYFEVSSSYARRFSEKPLFKTIGTTIGKVTKNTQMIVITDDLNRTELREAVKVARGGRGQVIVFLTPSVLYQAESLTDIETAYHQYTGFESFRDELDSLRGVSAYEVCPGDRLATVLAAGSRQREVR